MHISKIVQTATIRQFSVTSVSTVANGALGAVFYFVVARLLGSSQYGEFSLALTTIVLIAGIVDFGMAQGLVRYVSKYKLDKERQVQIANYSLRIKAITGVISAVLIFALSKWFLAEVLNQPHLTYLVPLVVLGVIGQLFFSFSSSFSQALERFWLWGSLMVGANLFRLFVLAFFLMAGSISSYTATLSYVIPPILGFAISLLFFKSRILTAGSKKVDTKELFEFNKWVTGFVIISTFGSRLDTYLMARFTSLSMTGVYALATQIVTILPQLTVAMGVVTSPKFSSFSSWQENKKYTIKSVILTTFLSVGCSLILFPLGLLVINFSGTDFSGAITPLLILLLSMAIFMAGSPIRDSIMYYLGRPQILFWIVVGHTAVIALLGLWLIPLYSISGAALTSLLGQIFILFTSVIYFSFNHKK